MVIGMPLGRRNCIIIGNVLITIGGIIQAASYSVPQIIVARVLCVCYPSSGLLTLFFPTEKLNGLIGCWYCSMLASFQILATVWLMIAVYYVQCSDVHGRPDPFQCHPVHDTNTDSLK